jgi:hypothetical protein
VVIGYFVGCKVGGYAFPLGKFGSFARCWWDFAFCLVQWVVGQGLEFWAPFPLSESLGDCFGAKFRDFWGELRAKFKMMG